MFVQFQVSKNADSREDTGLKVFSLHLSQGQIMVISVIPFISETINTSITNSVLIQCNFDIKVFFGGK